MSLLKCLLTPASKHIPQQSTRGYLYWTHISRTSFGVQWPVLVGGFCLMTDGRYDFKRWSRACIDFREHDEEMAGTPRGTHHRRNRRPLRNSDVSTQYPEESPNAVPTHRSPACCCICLSNTCAVRGSCRNISNTRVFESRPLFIFIRTNPL